MKNLLLPSNHYSLSVTSDVKAICEPIERFGIKSFCFLRYHRDGSIFTLITNPKLYQHHFTKEYRISPDITNDVAREKFYHLALHNEHDKYNQAIDDFKNIFNVHHPLFLFENNNTYLDLFIYSYNTNHLSKAINSYMSHMDSLNNFKMYFKYQANALIKKSNLHKIYLPEHMRINFEEAPPSQNINNNEILRNTIFLTTKQKTCLQFLIKGKTAKEIARLTGVSFRTVEDHINSIKLKFNCRYKAELLEKAIQLITINPQILIS